MTDQEYWKVLYRNVKQKYPELYERAVQIGHIAMINFGGSDEVARATSVELAVIHLIHDIMDPLEDA